MRLHLLGLIVAVSVLPLAGCSDGSPSGSPASSTAAPAASVAPSVVNAPTLSADAQVKLAAWFADTRHKQGMRAIDHGLGDFRRSVAITPAAPGDFTTIRSACNDLDHDLNIIKDFDPIPDPQSQALWSSALTNLRQGATDCLTGATANDAAQVARAKAALDKGDTDYAAVVARLGSVLGVAPTPTPS
ncbi:hypothetical protein [Kitasatospora sp. DSM 101779]|uniref:hypothetical protein n=1 Tax=Kitasatospora sp. DSM 101779 TaxID=2853165 RepID=UPI0021DAF17E|nr:hypothetical protein [Kitasatospora sp. DSM 101779]MCU7826802.1 hypothetical protein [Kitasatospora sp. DSM 101779]